MSDKIRTTNHDSTVWQMHSLEFAFADRVSHLPWLAIGERGRLVDCDQDSPEHTKRAWQLVEEIFAMR